jgi:hypothetical protein
MKRHPQIAFFILAYAWPTFSPLIEIALAEPANLNTVRQD